MKKANRQNSSVLFSAIVSIVGVVGDDVIEPLQTTLLSGDTGDDDIWTINKK